MKTWYLSKTLWLNTLAAVFLIAQTRYGFVIDPEAQAGLLSLINIVLRAITKAPLDWSTPATFPGNREGGFINRHILVAMFLMLAAVLLLLTGCATTKSAPLQISGTSLLAVKSTIVVAATSADRLCKNGTLTVPACTQIRTDYEAIKPAYDAAVDAYLLLSAGGDPGEYRRSLARVQELAAYLLTVSGGAH